MDTVPYAIHCDKTHEPFTTTDVIIQRGWVHFENVGDGLHRHLVRIDCSSRFEDLSQSIRRGHLFDRFGSSSSKKGGF